jgi:hypothetical protein
LYFEPLVVYHKLFEVAPIWYEECNSGKPPQGLFIPMVTALYFAGALKTKCNHYGFISHNNRGSLAGSVAPHFHAKEKVWRETVEVQLRFISCPINSWVVCSIFLETLFSLLNLIVRLWRKVS